MKTHFFIFLTFIFIGVCTPLHATEPQGDLIIIGGDTLTMYTWPLGKNPVLHRQVKKRADWSFSSANPDGLVCIWRLDGERLYLDKVREHCGEKPYSYVSLDSISDAYKDNRGWIFAPWFTGEMRVVSGSLLSRYGGKVGGLYSCETVYGMENGVVVEKQVYHHKQENDDERIYPGTLLKENFNGDLFPELSNQRLTAHVRVLSNGNGKVDSLRVRLKIGKGEWSDYPLSHPYVKELKRCVEMESGWKMERTPEERVWEDMTKIVWDGKGCKTKWQEWQTPDTVYYHGMPYILKEYPLQYDTRLYACCRPYFNNFYSIFCVRGYKATWEIIGDCLFLKRIYRKGECKPFPLEKLFPGIYPDKKVQAVWYHGTPTLFYNQNRLSYKMEESYPVEMDCWIRNGVLEHKEIYHNSLIPCDEKALEECVKKLRALDWSEYPKLNKMSIIANYTILPNPDGSVRDVQLNVYASGVLRDGYPRMGEISIPESDYDNVKTCREELSKVRWEVLSIRNAIQPVKGTVELQRGLSVMELCFELQELREKWK